MFRYVLRDKLNYLLPESETDMTVITMDGKLVDKIHFHFQGEDGNLMWIGFELADGTKQESFYFKGTV